MNLDKIKKDKFYNSLLENNYSIEQIVEAGYFEEDTPVEYNLKNSLNYLCTPLDYNLYSKNPAIYVLTGSFAPFHDGHFSLLKNSEKFLNNLGYNSTGYIAPDADTYVVSKKIKDNNYFAENRINHIQNMIKNENIDIDPWMCLFRKEDINFTQYIERLDLYIKKYLNKSIPIFFICGGDNANFWRAFEFVGNCLVFNRKDSKYSSEKKYFESKYAIDHEIRNRIFFIDDFNNDNSSTQIRKNSFEFENKKNNLFIRQSNNLIEKSLIQVISKNFDFTIIENAKNQQEKLKLINFNNVISLDSLTNSKYNIRVSRVYNLFGNECLYYNIDNENSRYPDDKEKEYTLFDDDIFTGGTINFTKNHLKLLGYKINSRYLSFKNNLCSNDEVLDARDFIIGGKNNGLVVELPNGKLSRVPYIYPFINQFKRGNIKNGIQFAIDILEINLIYCNDQFIYENNTEQYEFWKLLGMENSSIESICKYWICELKKLL